MTTDLIMRVNVTTTTTINIVGVPQYGGLSKVVSRYKAVKIAWCNRQRTGDLNSLPGLSKAASLYKAAILLSIPHHRLTGLPLSTYLLLLFSH